MEAMRILKNEGLSLHFIDLSDHFQHQDKSITKINFLRFSEDEWKQIAGNEFAYCNRLRASDYINLFSSLSFGVERNETALDSESLKEIKNNFIINAKFSSYSNEDLCTVSLRLLMKK